MGYLFYRSSITKRIWVKYRTKLIRSVCKTHTIVLQAFNKKLSYHRVTARCVLSVVILPIATQQCRNYLYDKS